MPHCRICGGKLRRILTCENMPRAAQHLPIPAETAHDGGVRLEVCECAACGVVQLASAPVPYWKDVIRAVGFSAEMRGGLAGKKGIELGCGDGAYLRLLAGTGLHAYGLEHDAGNVERCRAAGLNVHQGYLDEGTLLLESPFDAFFVFSWLEHLPDIPTFLDTILQNLAENAVGIAQLRHDPARQSCHGIHSRPPVLFHGGNIPTDAGKSRPGCADVQRGPARVYPLGRGSQTPRAQC